MCVRERGKDGDREREIGKGGEGVGGPGRHLLSDIPCLFIRVEEKKREREREAKDSVC